MDAAGVLYVGRLVIAADVAAYAAQTQGTWRQVLDVRRLKPPFKVYCRTTDIGSAVTTAALQLKLQVAHMREGEEIADVPSHDWMDADEAGTAIETTALTAQGKAGSNVLTEPLGDLARLLFKGTSANWQTVGQYIDAWLVGSR